MADGDHVLIMMTVIQDCYRCTYTGDMLRSDTRSLLLGLMPPVYISSLSPPLLCTMVYAHGSPHIVTGTQLEMLAE